MSAPLRLSFDVACPPDHAFRLWTSQIGTWWPPDHTVTGDSGIVVVLEDGVGGRIYERAPDGVEQDWGEVSVWKLPARLAYLWHLRRDRADVTEVEVRLVSQGDAGTRIEIEHRGWERLGAGGEQLRERNRAGWETLLPHYLDAVAKGET
jgi:hypothetical protein